MYVAITLKQHMSYLEFHVFETKLRACIASSSFADVGGADIVSEERILENKQHQWDSSISCFCFVSHRKPWARIKKLDLEAMSLVKAVFAFSENVSKSKSKAMCNWRNIG